MIIDILCSVYVRGNEDECSNHGSQEDVDSPLKDKKVDRQYTLERKSKSMPSDIQRDIYILGEKSIDNGVESVQFLSDREDDGAEMDAPPIWEPPGPLDPEDELEDAAAAAAADECCDGSKRAGSSSLEESKDGSSNQRKFNEENRRAMLAVANSKFNFIVSQLIQSAGFSLEEGESWSAIVARLCWEAASLLKPDIDGKPVDPAEYIKVKCIATGSCNERYYNLPIDCLYVAYDFYSISLYRTLLMICSSLQ